MPAFDTTLLHFVVSLREPVGIFFFSLVTHLADTLTVGLVLFVAALTLLLHKKSRSYSIGLIVAVAGAKITEVLLKIFIGRARPDGYELLHLDSYSFPSGHATAAMALYGFLAYVLWRYYPKWRTLIVTLSAVCILGVGFSRVYLGVHYPSDVVGGYVVGVFWIYVGIAAAKYWRS